MIPAFDSGSQVLRDASRFQLRGVQLYREFVVDKIFLNAGPELLAERSVKYPRLFVRAGFANPAGLEADNLSLPLSIPHVDARVAIAAGDI